MRVNTKPKMKWEDAPDTITPNDLSELLGIGVASARAIFDKTDFPKISKNDIGNVGKADKEMARLYIQGFKVKDNSRNAMEYLILLELKKLNKQMKKECEKRCK